MHCISTYESKWISGQMLSAIGSEDLAGGVRDDERWYAGDPQRRWHSEARVCR